MSRAIQGLASQVDQLHQRLPKEMVCPSQRVAFLLPVGACVAICCYWHEFLCH